MPFSGTMHPVDPFRGEANPGTGSSVEPLRPTVLVVDDDRDLLAALRFSLEADGYRVRAFDSAEALLATEEDGHAVSCLVIDYVLPRANGLDLVRALRLRGVSAPTILITTHPSVRVREATAHLGVRILEKPLLGGMLAQAVREEVARQRG
jgi:FixJ family two-component response regulator